ncbi:MAG: ABC transporter permease, partial [Muribaculaceae bacterium]|nr:ABC transporter permease [Muribaculaceae bacterium]
PGNPEIKAFMEENSYEVAGDKMSSSDSAYFLRLITGIVIGVGVLISILAFFILMLSIFLLVQKSREKLRDLILLGYTPGSVAGYYYRLVATVNLLVVALAVVAVFAVRHFWSNGIESVSAEEGSVMPMLLIACGVLVALTLSNVMVIRHLVRRSARG